MKMYSVSPCTTGPLKSLITKLATSQSQPIDVLIPGGNKGDGLIYQGAFQLFSECNLNYTKHEKIVRNCASRDCDTLLILGSGGFSKYYHSMPERIQTLSSAYNKIFVLPSTFDVSVGLVKNFLINLPDNISLFCREERSYNNVKSILRDREVFLDHDTALFMDYSPWKNKKGNGTLYAFRNDAERSDDNISPVELNTDVSTGDSSDWRDLIENISVYDTIHTNRAHGMIAAAMLGKETYAYDSCYFKQREIYSYSLSHMPNVSFK